MIHLAICYKNWETFPQGDVYMYIYSLAVEDILQLHAEIGKTLLTVFEKIAFK